MVKLLKRPKKAQADPEPEAAGAQDAPASSEARATTEAAAGSTGPSAPTTLADHARPTYEMPGTVEFDPPISFEPAPPPPPSPRSSGSLLNRALGDPGELSAAERDRIAAMEFEQAISPVMELMRAAVPGAETPDEAARILAENQGEITPDPQGGAYVPGDAFDEDARVYYRLLRRDYERNPRPSEKRSVSHHLHGVYGKLTGTKGW